MAHEIASGLRPHAAPGVDWATASTLTVAGECARCGLPRPTAVGTGIAACVLRGRASDKVLEAWSAREHRVLLTRLSIRGEVAGRTRFLTRASVVKGAGRDEDAAGQGLCTRLTSRAIVVRGKI